MKISTAQLKPVSGDIGKNIEKHLTLINLAVSGGSDFVFFPELSLTGYEPTLARQLATHPDDARLGVFQQISERHTIGIALGVPTRENSGTCISMLIFRPGHPCLTYSKQLLHADELPYFSHGHQQALVAIQHEKIAPAICYESLQSEHAARAFQNGATVYIASVAKSAGGVAKACTHYPFVARSYAMAVFMANCVGFCDTFESAGQSAVWNRKGELVGKLNSHEEGILTYNLATEELTACIA